MAQAEATNTCFAARAQTRHGRVISVSSTALTEVNWMNTWLFPKLTNMIDSAGTYNRLVPCGGTRYCCSSDGSTCCNDDSKVFDVGSASVIKDLKTTGRFGISVATPTATASLAVDRTSSAKPSSTEANSGAQDASNLMAPNTAVGAEATSTSTSTSQKDHAHVSKTAIIAGAGAGLVIVIAASAMALFFMRRKYRKKLAENGKTNINMFPMSNDGFHKLQDPDKTPRPVTVPAPLHSPAPPYQPPAYGYNAHANGYGHGNASGVVEIDESYRVPAHNQFGQPIFEAPTEYGSARK